MKYCLFSTALLCLAASSAWGQSASTEYMTDINGRQVPVYHSTVGGQGQRTELSDSVNGRRIPREQVETRVLSDSPGGRVTETITKKYDLDGRLASTERAVSEEQKQGDRTTQRVTIYSSDVNGRMQETERRAIDTVKQGSSTVSNVVVSRPGLSGSFTPMEKRNIVTTTADGKVKEDETILRPGGSGQFTEAQREVRETEKKGNVTTASEASYEPDFTGAMRLHQQQVSTTTASPDGSSVTQLEIYDQTVPGGVREQNATQKLLEQRSIVRTKEPDGSVVETTSVRRPSPRDQNHLQDPVKISETVCTGKCDAAAQP